MHIENKEQDLAALKMLQGLREEIASERETMKFENSKRIVDENVAILDNLISRHNQRTSKK
jgi:hypothetical protein